MRPILNRVTITGADDSIAPAALFDLAAEFPFVEFGILLSAKQIGGNRFPSEQWLQELCDRGETLPLKLAGHVCGRWVRDIFVGNWPLFPAGVDKLFQRWQLNTHAEHTAYHLALLDDLILDRSDRGQQIIFQHDNVNTHPLRFCMSAHLHEPAYRRMQRNVATLFDLSHGAGILPEDWPAPYPTIDCGYAGGLAPANVAWQLGKLESVVGGRPIWIDVETHVRSHNDALFDLAKVRAFLEAAKPWVLA